MTAPVLGLLLAGGRSRRMGGGDKCLRSLGERTLLEQVVARARPQVAALLLNANGDAARFERFGLPVAADVVEGFAGPLAGVLTGMEWALQCRPDLPFVASIATDTPYFPRDLVARLLQAVMSGADLALAASGGQGHPVFGLWPVRLASALRTALVNDGVRKVDVWTAHYRTVAVEFAIGDVDPFFNANRPEDLAEAARLLGRAD